MYYVYKFMNKSGEVIYVGRTNNISSRINGHFSKKDKESMKKRKEVSEIQYCELDSLIHSYLYEIQIIDFYKPKFNKDYITDQKSQLLISFDDLEFKTFDVSKFNKMKARNIKKISKNKKEKMDIEQKEIFYFYKNFFPDFSDEELYLIVLIYEQSLHAYIKFLIADSGLNEDFILETLQKFIDIGFAEKISTEGFSFEGLGVCYFLNDLMNADI